MWIMYALLQYKLQSTLCVHIRDANFSVVFFFLFIFPTFCFEIFWTSYSGLGDPIKKHRMEMEANHFS